jgi:uncharacterized protein (TIGR03435 family)
MVQARLLAVVGIVAVVGGVLAAQTPASPAFEVVSIKRNTSSSMIGEGARSVGTEAGGRFVMEDGSAFVLIRTGFSDATEVIGAPAWVLSEHYDVQAKANGPATKTEISEMMRALLADRFKFVAHYEVREKATFSLIVARADGRVSPQLRRYAGDCAAMAEAAQHGLEKPALPTPASGGIPCGYSMGQGGIIAGGIAMSALARAIQGYADRPVIDKTGLPGYYDFTLNVSDDLPAIATPGELFNGLAELGLKLESDRTSLPVIVIDHIERPTAD